ncbi:DUF7108 domain-containing protein [Halospeciosus flavus]|uniref:RnhA operon protein n=1 Tax=Halospeciosus flavus TaxID=3032283 RepID=A0ABD5Z662_9EURY|nr:rnhA operon protein [Halospeciosus flavus]
MPENDQPQSDAEQPPTDELPDSVVDEAERLTRLARQAVVDDEAAAYREHRDELLDEHDFAARVREDERETLVCYPQEWLDDQGTVRTERIEDTDRAAEVPLSRGGEQGDFETAEERNHDLVETVRERHGDVHAANARVFADFMSNHYARSMATATADEIEEFRTEYVVRNAWLSDDQEAALEQSLRYVFDVAGKTFPERE